jgi:hypothetical protein
MSGSDREENGGPAEKRSPERRRKVELEGHALLADQSTFPIVVLDLSYDGCRISAPADLTPGQKLTLSVTRLGALKAEVRWYHYKTAGLRFVHSEVAKEETPRREKRIAVETEVLIRGSARPNYRTRAFDVSPSGCKLDFVERARVGDRLWVKIAQLEALECTVRWVEGLVGGVEFSRPIHPAVFDLLSLKLER